MIFTANHGKTTPQDAPQSTIDIVADIKDTPWLL
jgi:hypothetical protein